MEEIGRDPHPQDHIGPGGTRFRYDAFDNSIIITVLSTQVSEILKSDNTYKEVKVPFEDMYWLHNGLHEWRAATRQ